MDNGTNSTDPNRDLAEAPLGGSPDSFDGTLAVSSSAAADVETSLATNIEPDEAPVAAVSPETTLQAPIQLADPVKPPGPVKGHHSVKILLLVVVALVILVAAVAAGYAYGRGKTMSETTAKPAAASAMSAMPVPQGATILEQCEPGLGRQYILPKDIPGGPVYNVYQGKLTGIQYMISLKSLGSLDQAVNDL
ncbi:MAG: hypothetical protein ABI220_04685, partial [Candidatus Saccharimonadales bacterium]